ncbi:MAG: hypothetical protein FJ125_10685 [Deltaproteobacteria bacterium]|nr:hypothetical protein [Deltaproteobacteria bacterium]
MIDATQAAAAVVEYFKTVAGAAGPLGFSVQHSEAEGDAWVVECSYWEYFGARERSSFKVEVDTESGKIRRVQRLT